MDNPICFICGREPRDENDFKDFTATDDGFACPECAGDIENNETDELDFIGDAFKWSDTSGDSDDDNSDI